MCRLLQLQAETAAALVTAAVKAAGSAGILWQQHLSSSSGIPAAGLSVCFVTV